MGYDWVLRGCLPSGPGVFFYADDTLVSQGGELLRGGAPLWWLGSLSRWTYEWPDLRRFDFDEHFRQVDPKLVDSLFDLLRVLFDLGGARIATGFD